VSVFTPEQFARALRAAPDQLAKAIIPRLIQRAQEFRTRLLVRSRLRGRPGLDSHSGQMALSFKQDPDGAVDGQSLDSFRLTEYSTHPGVLVQEKGATIGPVKGSHLAIPLAAAKTSSGVKRGGVRSFSDTFVRKSKAGNLIVFQRNGKGEKPTPLFLLRKSVTIPPRLQYLESWQANQVLRREDLGNAVHKVLSELKA
jgi:hypothetical protein